MSNIWITTSITLFMVIAISLCSLFTLYYILPPNYELFEFKQQTPTKILTIQSNKELTISQHEYALFRIKHNKPTLVTFEGILKSESREVTDNELVKLNSSCAIIKNITPDILVIEIYSNKA
ncbi:MAG: hypothetical protein Gaeavirus8_17 [Gaeavirus sp.]|uniref:Uncharacterized protein n=1 Tax=Gaeavirus sp. TaxID=2487767 RepID=A0A3G4ZYT0_9VIRU|nr:MAG: hypothetical protein Gaeavirus8_17 [Gaeavirus sp.]